MSTEVIQLDSSDDEDSMPGENDMSTSVSCNVVNTKPLDISSFARVHSSSFSAEQPSTKIAGEIRTPRSMRGPSFTVQASSPNKQHPEKPTVKAAPLRSHGTVKESAATNDASSRSTSSLPLPCSTKDPQRRPIKLINLPAVQEKVTYMDLMETPDASRRLATYMFDAEHRFAYQEYDNFAIPQLYKCSYPGCDKIVLGNAGFMYHLWAHIVEFKEVVEDSLYPDRDLDFLTRCPQCLALYDTPFQMQIHYTRNHSRLEHAITKNACAVCEKDTGMSLVDHLEEVHAPFDAPYRCNICTYRCSVRMHLLDHYAKRHDTSSSLCCPFCIYTLNPPSKRSIIKARTFVIHMMKHDTHRDVRREAVYSRVDNGESERRKRIGCHMCALTFLSDSQRADHVSIFHKKVAGNFIVRIRKKQINNRRKSSIFVSGKRGKVCIACSRIRKKNCQECRRLAFLTDRSERRLFRYTDDAYRGGIEQLASTNGDHAQCACGFTTTNGNKAAVHLIRCVRPMEVTRSASKREPPSHIQPTAMDIEEEDAELDLFGITQLRKVASPPNEARNGHVGARDLEDQDDDDDEFVAELKKTYTTQPVKLPYNFETFEILGEKAKKVPCDPEGALAFYLKLKQDNGYDRSVVLYKDMEKRRE